VSDGGGVMAWLRRTFVRGILLILPLMITFLILGWLFDLVTGLSRPGAERLLVSLGAPLGTSPAVGYLIPVISTVITLGVILAVGLVGGNYLGKRAWATFEAFLLRLPIVRWFYGSARQLMDAVTASGRGAFREVVLVEYPRRGVWCLGFVTAPAEGLLEAPGCEDCVYVFIPTTPNPTSGYTIVVPRADAPVLNMTVDEGLKVIFSGGFISPAPRPRAKPPGSGGLS